MLSVPANSGMPAALRVPVDGRLPFVQRADDDSATRRVGALTFDEARRHDPRPHNAPVLDVRPQLLQPLVVVAHVANGGHAAGDLQHGVPPPFVTVHVEETWQQEASLAVDHRAPVAAGSSRLVD